MKKGDVGMAKHFSKKYGNKGWASQLPALLCQDACQRLMLHPTSLPQEEAAITSMVSEVRIHYVWLILAYDWPCPHEAGKALH